MAAMLQRLSRNCRTLRPVFRYLSEEIHIIKVVRYTHTFGLRYCSTAIPESQADDEQNMDDLTWGERLRVDDSLPQWMKTRKGQRKLYAKFGKASGINPAVAWPTRNELAEMIEDEREWRPTLAQMQSNINAQRRAQKIEQIKREKHIEACLAKMPKLEKQFYEDRRK
uniref:Large ribosomal subunit protein mL64 n=1 Tax=Saccoglossus kowalevskii TaxID=10224 RepID=A0ABM0GPJ9_SACKO|nr:PREDICTED: growth arrest and DNA damage-inducible proteins-interacting protein 1-like [Saccoglossus kowalevskii]